MSDEGTTRTPVTLCWHCDRMLDAASDLEGQAKPESGSVSLCLYCGAIAIFGDDLVLRRPSRDELDGLFDEQTFRPAFSHFQRMRQYVMLDGSLLCDREDPDR